MRSKNKSEWREVFRERHDGPHHLKKSLTHGINAEKDSAKREGDILKLDEMAAHDEKQEDEERHHINKLLQQLHKE